MEEVHYLIPEKLKIIQNDDYFKFGTDSVFLANFTRVRTGDLVVDLGSGSGVIPLLLAYKQDPEQVIGVELQSELVEMSRRSVGMNGLGDIIDIREGDLKRVTDFIKPDTVDVVVSNPPYMPVGAGKITSNHQKAIARHEIKADLENVIKGASRVLKFGGILNLVHRAWRLAEVISVLKEYNLEPKKLRMVQPRQDRAPDSFLLRARKGGKRRLEMAPTLIVYKENSSQYTDEVKEMYGESRVRNKKD